MITCQVIQTKAAEEEDLEEPRNLQAGTHCAAHRAAYRAAQVHPQGPAAHPQALPKLPEITDALLADKGGGHTLFQRHQAKVSTLTREQTSFLQAQHRKYEQRLRRDKRVRQHVGTAILAAGLEGCGNKMGVDLRVVRSASLDSVAVATATPEQGWTPAAPPPRPSATRPRSAARPADVSRAPAVQKP